MTHPIARLHQACAALGTRLFTVSILDRAAGLSRRAYTSHPAEYPAQGTKPMLDDAWFDHCIRKARPFLANTPAEFEKHFFDHALITSMGLGSALNIPVADVTGTITATVNLLAEAHHFTPEKLQAYLSLVAEARATLLTDALFTAT
ncbi:GAF domain-containing protein [Paragemmobacter straminiformis]|nr:GAF domain-containing protein [Gemmobacter straminiformis]